MYDTDKNFAKIKAELKKDKVMFDSMPDTGENSERFNKQMAKSTME